MTELGEMIKSVIEDIPYLVANLANISAVIYSEMDRLNWAGFYIMREGQLVLGPFQGKVACIKIPVGRGVCGTAVAKDETQLVEDVHLFPGHIACDGASESEIVVPIHLNGEVWGVLDIDSPVKARFGAAEKEMLEEVVKVLEAALPDMI